MTMRHVVLLLAVFLLGGCGYNSIQSKDEAVTAGWSEVVNQYQRRADLVPNLVNTVKGYAEHEEEVLTKVTEARASVGKIQISAADLTDEAKLKQFQAAQGELSGALSRLLAVAENYPQLKANQNFLELQSQLEGTENRIAVERRRFNETVQDYNTAVRVFPASVVASIRGFAPKAFFEADQGAEKAPTVKF
jgi:LemA protein